MQSLVQLALSFVLVFAGTGVANALVIDDFEEGPFSISLSTAGGSVSDEQTGLSAGSVLGGVRNAVLTLLSGPSASASVSSLASGDDFVVHGHSGFSATLSRLRLEYDGTAGGTGSLGVDLTADGADRFAFIVSSSNPDATSVRIAVRDTFGSSQLLSTVAATPGVHAIFFSGFTAVDLTSVAEIDLTLSRSDSSGRTSIALSHFATLPEPATAALLGLGLLALAFSGRTQGL